MDARQLLLVAAAFLSSCSVLPPSMRDDQPAKATEGTLAADTGMKVLAPRAAPKASDEITAKVYPGPGVFINPKPPGPPAAPGPEDVTLNFEGLDVREV